MRECEDRKKRSEARLRAEGVPILSSLPVIEPEADSLRRTTAAVAQRAAAVTIAAVGGETGDGAFTRQLTEQFGLAPDDFSPEERTFLSDPDANPHARLQWGWRYECVGVFLWALGFASDLDRPDAIVDVGWLASMMRELGRDGLARHGDLRAQALLLDEADLIYRYHWAVRNAQLAGEPAPAGLDGGVVVERHRALNWLIGTEEDWDDVATHT